MKSLLGTFLILISTVGHSQNTWYCTDGRNRLTEEQLREACSKLEERFNEGNEYETFVSVFIRDKEFIGDSVIAHVTININTSKPDSWLVTNPLLNYKNKQLPYFELPTLSGDTFSAEQLPGKPTLINFWFTQCTPCVEEMPLLNMLADKYAGAFNFIAVTYQSADEVSKFLKKHPYHFTHLVEARAWIDTLGFHNYPTNIFLDKEGRLAYIKGGLPKARKELTADEMSQLPAVADFIRLMEKLK